MTVTYTQLPDRYPLEVESGTDYVHMMKVDGPRGTYYYPLTPCCDASAKGTEWGPSCRGCYRDLPEVYGIVLTTLPTEDDEV